MDEFPRSVQLSLMRWEWKRPIENPDFLVVKPNPATRGLETVVVVISAVSAVVVLGGAILIMLGMTGPSKSLGARLTVAVAAIVVLAALESQIAKMVQRRRTWSLLGPESVYNRPYTMWSCLVMLVCAVILIGLAYLLP